MAKNKYSKITFKQYSKIGSTKLYCLKTRAEVRKLLGWDMKWQTFNGFLPTNNGDFIWSNLNIKKNRKTIVTSQESGCLWEMEEECEGDGCTGDFWGAGNGLFLLLFFWKWSFSWSRLWLPGHSFYKFSLSCTWMFCVLSYKSKSQFFKCKNTVISLLCRTLCSALWGTQDRMIPNCCLLKVYGLPG